MTKFLRQRLQQLLHFFSEQARHQPLTTVFRNLVELRQWQIECHTIVAGAGIVVIGEAQLLTVEFEMMWKGVGGDASRLMAHQLLTFEKQQLRLHGLGGPAPRLECRQRNNVVACSLLS